MTAESGVASSSIRLRPDDQAAIRRHGESTFPHECCGLLLGRMVEGCKVVERAEPLANEREDSRHNRFLITPETFLRADRDARARGLDILGFYHSHPDAPAVPSDFDREHAWPFYSYIIVSVVQGEARELNSWRLDEDRSRYLAEIIRTAPEE